MNMAEEVFVCSRSFSEDGTGLDRRVCTVMLGLRILQKQTEALKGTSND